MRQVARPVLKLHQGPQHVHQAPWLQLLKLLASVLHEPIEARVLLQIGRTSHRPSQHRMPAWQASHDAEALHLKLEHVKIAMEPGI